MMFFDISCFKFFISNLNKFDLLLFIFILIDYFFIIIKFSKMYID